MLYEMVIVIIGAGPSGLSVALELARRGFTNIRVIKKTTYPTTKGKALAIHPHTLELFEPSGLTKELLPLARKINHLQLCKNKQKRELVITGIHHRYDYLAALEQEEIEKILISLLKINTVKIERGKELTDIKPRTKQIVVKTKDGEHEQINYDLLIGADGVYSTTRQLMNIAFEGSDDETIWTQAEVQVKNPEKISQAYLYMDKMPFMAAIPAGKDVFRIVTPSHNVLERFSSTYKTYTNFEVEKVLWDSEFTVGYRAAETMYKDSVVLIGDAANVHSPIGGRGMNKGMEDAYSLAESLANDIPLENWARERERQGRKIVRTIKFISLFVQNKGILGNVSASVAFNLIPFVRKFVVKGIVE